jgi:hypothetical protein
MLNEGDGMDGAHAEFRGDTLKNMRWVRLKWGIKPTMQFTP